MRRLLIGTVLALLASAALGGEALSAPLIIDTYVTPGSPVAVTDPSSANGSIGPHSGAGILGTRTVAYNRVPAGNFDFGEGVRVGGGDLRLATATSAVQIDATYSGFGSLNLTGYGALELVFVPVLDLGVGPNPFNIRVELTTSTGLLAVTTAPPSGIAPAGGIFSIPLSGLTGPGNLGNVTGIKISINDSGSPSTAADFVLDEARLTEIPEPGSIALWTMLGMAGAWYGRRRLKNTQSAR